MLPRVIKLASCRVLTLTRCASPTALQGVQADPGAVLPDPGTEPEPAQPASVRRSSTHGSSTKERGVQCELLPPLGEEEGEGAQGEPRVVIKVRQRTLLALGNCRAGWLGRDDGAECLRVGSQCC